MKNNKITLSIELSMNILFIIILFAGCNINCIHGKGNITKNDRVTGTFNAIDVSGAYNIILSQDSITSVAVEADENLHQYITTKVENNKLIIDSKVPICGSKDINVYINAPGFENIDLSGAVNVKCVNKLTLTDLKLNVSGASELNLDLAVQNLNIDCSGAVELIFSGTAANVKVNCSGASKIKSFDLLTENFSINSSGAAEAEISVSKQLDVDISGAGTVLYKGSPQINQEISGAGSIKKVE